ncbi:MAG: ABC transporter permease subunit [Lentisphaeria bacterium]|nr:ABC transporter permease subunit [Lentisphaeria bacterium]
MRARVLLQQILRLVLCGAGAFAVLFGLAWLVRPELEETVATPSPAEVAAVERLRDTSFDPASPIRLHCDVDYGAGSAAEWYPKGEAPILAELVAEGRLPPVHQRLGEEVDGAWVCEPCVMEGVDGIGRYGGTWMRVNGLLLNSRMGYHGLVRFSPQGFPLVPHLAKSWEVSEDCREWTFHLRRGAKWSDGHPFTSADILYWWRDEQNCEAVTGTSIAEIMKVNGVPGEVVGSPDDPYRVTFRFPEPNGIFLARLASYEGLHMLESPAHYRRPYHPELGDQDLIQRTMDSARLPNPRAVYSYIGAWDNPRHPRLWPWIFRKFSPTPPDAAVRNPYYWVVDPKGNQLPYIDRILSDEVSQELVPIRAANGAVTFQSRYLSFDQYTYLMSQRREGGYEVFHWYGGDRSWFVIQPNLNRRIDPARPHWRKKRDLMRDKRFRQAMSLAIDRASIITAEYNGRATPAQVAPGPESPFYNEAAFRAYTDYDPGRANALLDELGLTERDPEGYRTFADGTPMTFLLDYTKGLTSDRPVQFVVDDWAAVGVRVVPRQRNRSLWDTERQGLLHDFNVWISNGEHYPLIQPRFFVPVTNSYFAMAYAKWQLRGGLRGDPAADGPGCEPIPEDHPLREALNAYLEASRHADIERQRKAFDRALEIAAENVWSINICTTPPVLVVVKNGLRNVPKTSVYSWDFQSPGNAGIETFFLQRPEDSEGARADIREQIQRPTLRPGDPPLEAAEATVTPDPGTPLPAATAATPGRQGVRVAALLRWLILLALVLFVVLTALRHPFVARRLLIMVPTLAFISVIVFTIIQLPPGDFLTAKIIQLQEQGDTLDLQVTEDLRQQFHLDKSLPEQYLRWLGVPWFWSFESRDKGLLQGNLGRSMENGREVNQLVGDRLLLTFLISLGTILFTWVVALPIGVYSAVRQYSVGDYVITFLGFLGMCIPGFLLALLLMYLAQRWFGIAITGLFSPEYAARPEWSWGKVADLLQHIWLPVVVVGVGGTAGMIRVMRANLLDELRKPYVVTARAKGVRPLRVLLKYPFRVALNPFISGIGHLFPALISGNAIVAIVLSLPTVGPLMLNALMVQDMYLAGSMLMVFSLLSLVGTLVSDLLLLWLDPRIRMGGSSE